MKSVKRPKAKKKRVFDDSKVSDEAKHDARELSYAVYEYDRTAKS